MATPDDINIFGIPPEQPEKKDESLFTDDSLSRLGISEGSYLNRLAQIQNMKFAQQEDMMATRSARAAEKKVLRDQYFSDLAKAAKDPTQEKRDTALESFFKTPFMFQMGQYVFDPTGVPTDVSEFDYASRKLDEEFKENPLTPESFYFNPVTMGYEPMYTNEQRQYKQQRDIALLSIPPGIGGIAGIAQSVLGFPARALRRGMTMDGQGGGGGGISGLSKQEFIQQEIDTKARDGMFISPLNRYLITTAPKNLKGQALLDHIKANQSKGGYKADEIRYTGVEEYIKENPEATTQELIDYASENKPRVEVETLGDEMDQDNIFLPIKADPFDPLDGTDHSTLRAIDILHDIKRGDSDIFDDDFIAGVDAFEGMDFAELYYNAYANSRISSKQYETLMGKLGVSNPGLLPADMAKTSQDALENQKPFGSVKREGLLEELAEEISMYEFYDNPYKLIELDEGVSNLKAYGNDDVGYQLIQDGEKIDTGREIFSEGEAQNQMKILLRDQGVFEGMDGQAEFKSYVLNEQMPHVNGTDYQEMKLLMPSLETRGFKTFKGHYDEDYEIGTLTKVDSKLDDGTDTMHIPEFQADVHQKGASTGYDTPKDKKYYDEVLIPQAVKDFESQAKRILGDDEFNRLKTLYTEQDSRLYLKENDPTQEYFVLEKISDKIKSNYRVTPSTWYDYAQLDKIRSQGLAPDYPHKEYVPEVVKQMVVKAIDEGKDTISFPTSTSILERTGKQPRKVGNIEVAQVSAPTELDKQIYELSKNTADLEFKATKRPESPTSDPIYFGSMEAVTEHIVDLKNMDRQLNQFEFPDADFSSPNIRRQYTNFEIGMYRDTLDDPAFNVQALDDFARSYETKLNELGYEVVERADPSVNPKLQELYDEYGDSVSGQQLRTMEADALESTQPLTAKALNSGYSHTDFDSALLYNKSTNTFTTAKNLENDSLAKITSQGEFVIRDPSLEDADGAAIKSYATYRSIERAFGGSVAKQIRKLAEEGKIPQSYGSNFYDLAAGHQNQNSIRLTNTFEKTLPYSLDVNKQMGGQKFITDYDQKIPSELKRVADKYGGKFEEGSLDGKAVYGEYDPTVFEADSMPIKRLKVNILRITPEMRDKVIKEGMASMYKGGIVNKVKSMDKPIQGNRREM